MKKIGILGMAAMMMALENNIFKDPRDKHEKRKPEDIREPSEPEEPKKVIPTNHKEYTIDGITVTALSYRRAANKVRKIQEG